MKARCGDAQAIRRTTVTYRSRCGVEEALRS